MAKKKAGSMERSDNLWGYAMIAPAVVLFMIFMIVPFVYSLWLSFQARTGVGMTDFAWGGLSQYVRVFQDESFWNSLKATALYTFPTVLLHLVFGLLMAVLVNKSIYLRTPIRAIVFIPVILSTVVVSLIWQFMFTSDTGLFSQIVGLLGGDPGKNWLKAPKLVMYALIIVGVWKWIGYFMVLYLAALQDIPRTLYEAADIDGATGVKKLVYITVPLLRNITAFLMVISIINTFQVFDQIYMLTNGGPLQRTDVIVYYIYRVGFKNYDMPYAAALSWMLFVVIFTLTAIQMKLNKQKAIF